MEKVNALELKAHIARKAMTQERLAEAIGIDKTSLWYKMTGQREFTVEEVRSIRDVLGLTDQAIKDIFLI